MPAPKPTAKNWWIAQLLNSNSLPLTALDHLAPQIYTRLVYGFHFDNSKQNEAIADLQRSLKIAFTHWPFLAGQVHHPPDGEPVRLLYSTSPNLWNINQQSLKHQVFCHQDLTSQSNHPNRAKFPWSFSEISGPNGEAQPARLDKDILSLSPQHPDWTTEKEWYHPVTLMVTFVDQGLLLCFSIHHKIMDGQSLTQFLRCFSRDGEYKNMGSFDSQIQNKTERLRNSIAPRYAYFHETNILNELKGTYDFGTYQLTPPPKSTCVAKILTFTSDEVQRLKDQANVVLQKPGGSSSGKARVSSFDVISGLLWLHVTRARLRRLRGHPNKPTRFATAVDLRSYLDRILPNAVYKLLSNPSEYIGNMYLRIMTSTTVSELVQEAMTQPNEPAKIQAIAHAAWLICKEIMRLRNDKSLLSHHLSLMHQAIKPHEKQRQQPATPERRYSISSLSIASSRALQNDDTGLDCSSWLSMGGDTQFKIQGIHDDPAEGTVKGSCGGGSGRGNGTGKCRPR